MKAPKKQENEMFTRGWFFQLLTKKNIASSSSLPFKVHHTPAQCSPPRRIRSLPLALEKSEKITL